MFNIGGWEVLFILLIVLLLWKPEELQDRARQLGRWWARLTHSPWWREMMHLRRRAEEFVLDAAREANLDGARRTAERAVQARRSSWEDEPRATRPFRPQPPHPETVPPDGSKPPASAADARAASTPPSAPAEPSSPDSSGHETESSP